MGEDKQCPKCGLWNSESANRCDCGYDFIARQLKTSYVDTKYSNKVKKEKGTGCFLFAIGILFWSIGSTIGIISGLSFFPEITSSFDAIVILIYFIIGVPIGIIFGGISYKQLSKRTTKTRALYTSTTISGIYGFIISAIITAAVTEF